MFGKCQEGPVRDEGERWRQKAVNRKQRTSLTQEAKALTGRQKKYVSKKERILIQVGAGEDVSPFFKF